ncbi:unnamed protein product [Vitrella brassicaformis CCMP3155]|uniref:Piwi domain-containing protein n=1 Tax=Vitrella brassicaformis (strain CCMP3155) TaxID=1169540 RepID=A0A0G4H2S4_VITBC|nr:unnamed protein product [Vitrella brassicaformis CCMP3155]|eukprot:CEM37964.1 unnamed protein product [Vitrella brassicaformis CCMP3155]
MALQVQGPAPRPTDPQGFPLFCSLGVEVEAQTNLFEIGLKKKFAVWVYATEFDPPVNALGPQRALIYRNSQQILQSLNAFGGALLYQGMNTFVKVDTNIQPNHTASVTLPQAADTGEPQKINFIFRHTIDMHGSLDQETIQYLNCAVKRAMGQLRFQVIGRHLFLTGMMTAQPVDPELGGTTTVGNYQLLPGYFTSIQQLEASLYLQVDCTHRIIHMNTLRDVLDERRRRFTGTEAAFVQRMNEEFQGRRIITIYESGPVGNRDRKLYAITELLFGEPGIHGTFTRRQQGQDVTVSYAQYFQNTYGINLAEGQALVKYERTRRMPDGTQQVINTIILPSQTVTLTGMDESIRSNFDLNNQIANRCRMLPGVRLNRCRGLARKLQAQTAVGGGPNRAAEVLETYGITIQTDGNLVKGRHLGAGDEAVSFRYYDRSPDKEMLQEKQHAEKRHQLGTPLPGPPRNANFNINSLIAPANLTRWIVVYGQNHEALKTRLVRDIRSRAEQYGMGYDDPLLIYPPVLNMGTLNDPRFERVYGLHMGDLRERIEQASDPIMVVFILPENKTQAKQVYEAMKQRLTCGNEAVLTQGVQAKTVSGNRWNSALPKLVAQIACKLGGAAWALNTKAAVKRSTMVIGVECKKARGKSVVVLSATVDDLFLEYYTSVRVREGEGEQVDNFPVFIEDAIAKFLENPRFRGQPPRRFIIYRGGLGEGQKRAALDFELPMIEEGFRQLTTDEWQPEWVYIIVNKNVNQRFAVRKPGGGPLENPPPLTVFDQGVTDSTQYVFYGCHQFVTQGTVTPTKYEVYGMSANWDADMRFGVNGLCRITMQLSTLYQNWSGPIRVPAPVKYAETCARKVTEALDNQVPSDQLATKLWFL